MLGNNYAFIDGQNMYKNIRKQGWKIDYTRFKKYLEDKYNVEKVYIFFGYMEENKRLYDFLEKTGYCVLFKKISRDDEGNIKGNCDSDLIFRIGMEFWNFNKAVIVSGDGDFFGAVEILHELDKLAAVMSPDRNSCSEQYFILKKDNELIFMDTLKNKISLNENTHKNL